MKNTSIPIRFTINGKKKEMNIPPGITALQLIRDFLELKGTKEGCGIGECGACTIVVDGKAVNACLMFGVQLDGREVFTIEGLNESEDLHPIQDAFSKHHAVQCGFCTPGILMSTKVLLEENPNPSHGEILKAVSGNLCRCTGYQNIITAIEEVAGKGETSK